MRRSTRDITVGSCAAVVLALVAVAACVPDPGPGGGTTTTTTTTSTTLVGGACDAVTSDMDGATVTVATPAGGADGDPDGIGALAGFSGPTGLAIDNDCQLLVADNSNSILRSVTPSGDVTTVAGRRGVVENIDGPVADALLVYPHGVVVDSTGNVFISQPFNHVIRRLTPAGEVSTFVGTNGAAGTTDGVGSAARFDNPSGLAVDASDNLYVADTFNHTIRKVTPGGEVSTLAGDPGVFGAADGTGTAARFYQPAAVAVGADGSVYVTDRGNHTIRKVTISGDVTTIAGTAGTLGWDDGTGPSASFVEPEGIAVGPDGRLYVTDTTAHLVRRVTTAGEVTTIAGAPLESGATDGPGADSRFAGPRGIAVAADGTIYVADNGNRLIRSIVLS